MEMKIVEKEWPIEDRPRTYSGGHVWDDDPSGLYLHPYSDEVASASDVAVKNFSWHMGSLSDMEPAGPSDWQIMDHERIICWLADGLRGYHGVDGLNFCKTYTRSMLRTLIWAASRNGHTRARDSLSMVDDEL